MKKLKKTICIILSLTFILSAAFSFPLSADAATKNGTKYPTMVIGGINDMHYIYSDKNDPNSEKLAYDLTDIDASAVAKEIAAPLATGNYHDYCAAVLKSVEPIFSKLKLDNNGEASNGSGVLWKYNPDNVKNMRRWDKVFFITDYGTDVTRSDGDSVGYDWRLDPGVTADMIYVYAQEILRKTGAEKINFIFRCEGCTAGLEFIAKYADSLPINNVEFSWPTCLGITAISDVFSGKLKLDANALERYLRIDKDEIISKLDSKYADAAALGIAFVSVLNSFKLLNIPLSEVEKNL